MSFTQDVKKEIANLKVDDQFLKSELYGILKLKTELVIRNKKLVYEIKTNLLAIVRRITSIIKHLYKANVEVIEKERKNLDQQNIFIVIIDDKCKEILLDLSIIDEEYNFIEDISEEFIPDAVIRGFFLAKGSINDPKSSRYHLEFACNTLFEATYLIKQFNEFGIYSKLTTRRGSYIVYVKKAEQIGDVLKVIGSTNCMFEFENERIKRDLNNVVNRIINCDMANGIKTHQTAMKQLEQIEYIEKTEGFESLSIRLMEAVTLRTKNPDASLQELSDISEEIIGRYISKSGLSHCFKDLELHYLTLKAKETSK
jgi:DNA-binding protein WhiA